MTSKIIVNTIEADTGISSVTFASNINLQNDSSILVSSSGVTLGTGSTIAAPSANEITLSTNSAERLRLTSAGKMGLGTQTPDKLLTVSGANTVARFKSSTTYVDLIFQNDTKDNGYIQYNNLGNLNFYADSGSTPTLTIKGGSPGNVGINTTNPERKLEVVDTASSLTYPVAVSNFTDASAGVGAGIAFHLTAGGNARGELGLVYAGNSNSDGTDFVFRPNDGSTGQVERLRITNDGKFGFNTTNPGAFDSGANHLVLLGNTSGTGNAGITIASGTDSYGNIYFADGTSGADAYRGHIAYNHNGNTMRFATNGSEKVRIDSSGRLLLNSGTDVRIELGTTGSTGTNNRNHLRGDGANMKYNCCSGGGHFFEANGGERMRISSNGHVNIGDGYIVSNTGLHVGRSSGGTAAGESVLAATLGNGSTMVSALLTVKNAGNRGTQGHVSGSPLAKFEFNNGTAFEIDKYGRRTLPYQPTFKCKLSGATGANFTGTLVFNNVSYNIGSHYNSSNGRFTAPIDGRYLFAWYTNMERAGGNGSFYAEWYINGNAQGNRMYSHHSGAWEQIGGTIIFDLNASDYVEIRAMTSGNWDGGSYGSYSGCLLG